MPFMVVILALGLIQPCASRRLAAILYAGLGIAFISIEHMFNGASVFFAVALSESLFIILAAGISPAPKLVLHLIGLCMISILVSFVSWRLWENHIALTYYNSVYVCIYLSAIVATISGTEKDGRCRRRSSWLSYFRYDHNSWFGYVKKCMVKAKA